MDKDNIFTMTSVKGSAVSADDLAAAEEVLGGEMTEVRRSRLKEYAGGFSPSKVRNTSEYQQFLNFVKNRDIPGIHPDDIRPRWVKMFGSIAPGQLSAIIDALKIDGALDEPTSVYERVRRAVQKTLREDIGKVWMDYGHYGSDSDAPPDHDTSSWSPLDDVEDDPNEILTTDYVSHPFKEKKISETKWLRTFARDTHSEELVWHRDREDRIVRVVEGIGWKIQMDGQLPIDLKPGSVHRIPARSWHRVLMGESVSGLTVLVEKLKKGDKVKVDGKKATVKVPDGRGDLVGVDYDDPEDMEMVPSKDIEKIEEKKESTRPRSYGAPEGSKRDSKLDKIKADIESGDPKREKRAYAARERMEKKEREKPGYENKPRSDTKTESSELSESDLKYLICDILEEELSKKTKATLRKKAKERGLTPGSVESEYKKGLAAYGTSGSRKGMSQHQWAMARVNSATPSKDWATVKKSKAKKK